MIRLRGLPMMKKEDALAVYAEEMRRRGRDYELPTATVEEEEEGPATVSEIMDRASLTKQYLYRMLREGRIPGAYREKDSKQWRIPRDTAEKLIVDYSPMNRRATMKRAAEQALATA